MSLLSALGPLAGISRLLVGHLYVMNDLKQQLLNSRDYSKLALLFYMEQEAESRYAAMWTKDLHLDLLDDLNYIQLVQDAHGYFAWNNLRDDVAFVPGTLRLDPSTLIEMRDGPQGPRAGIRNSLDVWEIVLVFMENGANVEDTLEYLDLPKEYLDAALDYYTNNPQEIQEILTNNYLPEK